MRFTYEAYRGLLALLREQGYALRDFHDYAEAPRCAILRHDIDYSLEQAVRLAELEAGEDVRTTWFVLLRTDFYNAASKAGREAIRHTQVLGHEIGLHFDEASYDPPLRKDEVIESIIVVIVHRVSIGKCCEIQSGIVIGHDGFGYTEDDAGKKQMVKHFGGVFIGNNVLISSNVCVCRGTIDDTVISDGTKVDNMCHIAHNCILKEDVALAYPCWLGGSTYIEKNGYLASATVRNQSVIGEGSFVGLGAVVVKDVEPHTIVAGVPAKLFKKEE